MGKKRKSGSLAWRQQQKDELKRLRAADRQRKERATTVQPETGQASQTTQLQWPAPRVPTESSDEYRFLNPYNFVRYLPQPKIPNDNPDAQLLGRCPPPPHDRYVGLTGRITCTLEVVTPLFVADTHDITVSSPDHDTRAHKSYRFFQYEGRDAIPASSLRGMVRSVFEAVTNSPFSIFNADARLEYRINPIEARRFRPGIVRSLAREDEVGKIALCEEAKVGAYYSDKQRNVLDNSWACGEEAYAVLNKKKTKVKLIARTRAELAIDDDHVVHGWVKVTGKAIETKVNESFFYFKDGFDNAITVSFDYARQADFNAILSRQLAEVEGYERSVQHGQLTEGDLVYVECDLEEPSLVRNIALAKVARLRYRSAIGDLLPNHLMPSTEYDALDISSRVFGWVSDTELDRHDASARVAYAGRVRFSHAVLAQDGDKGVFNDEISLAILGAPRPTTTLFYLRSRQGTWTEKERTSPGAAQSIGYDGSNLLRGRKFYRHHGGSLNRLEYERAGQKRDHQNRSVRGVRAPGNLFTFDIDFHNLAPLELGALLWVLRLEDQDCFFRLGYGKPLGFGSVRILVTHIALFEPDKRYGSLHSHAWRNVSLSEYGGWMKRFVDAMQSCYGRPFNELENIRDLFALLREPEETLPDHIHYPRSTLTPVPEGKNFEWFAANNAKATNPDQAGKNLTLQDPADETSGLPLLRKEQQEHH